VSVMGIIVTFCSARYDFKLVILHKELLICVRSCPAPKMY